ncbi:MAG: helix-turn-helix domain-containing protein [Clostridia bacterium]|nr:helix-turn-helix domain-containing protein [Clostridia bacterium]
MSVFRVHKTNNFTVMSNYHFKEKEMGLKAKGLLSLMLSLPDTWNYSVAGLVSLSKDGKDGVMSALAELEKFGYLTRKRVQNEKGQFSGIEYHIFEVPQSEKPIADNPILEKPISENPSQLNTNKIKFLKNKKNNNNSTNKNDFMNELKRIYQELEQDGK